MWKNIEENVKKVQGKPFYQEAVNMLPTLNFLFMWQSNEELFLQCTYNGELKNVSVRYKESYNFESFNPESDLLKLAACIYIIDQVKYQVVQLEGKKYTRQGMIQRVLQERAKKASELEYKIKLSPYLYGEHTLIKNDGTFSKVSIYDLDKKIGYIDNMDWKTNKLCTTKHILFLCNYLLENDHKLIRQKPFIEISLDPLQNYELTWVYNQQAIIDKLERKYIIALFGEGNTHLKIEEIGEKHKILSEISHFPTFKVRPEVFERLSYHFDNVLLEEKTVPLEQLKFDELKTDLYPYQKVGVHFCLFKKGAILADEMGLGKTLQAIAIAIQKKKYFGFQKALIVCPASLKYQWASEIQKFSNETVDVISGNPAQREQQYLDSKSFFIITNYESLIRDRKIVDERKFDFIILDEAQKIKNFNTLTATSIQSIHKEHCLVITGTPIENKLLDIYSIMIFIDKYALTPLWEFSYQHCIFDVQAKNKINAYYNLSELKERLSTTILRREKRHVLKDLPGITEKNIMLRLHPEQAQLHRSYLSGLSRLLSKKYKTQYDWDRIMNLLTSMRRVSNSTFLIEKGTNFSSKLVELKDLLDNGLNLKANNRKIIIFSEWLDSHELIGEILTEMGIGFTKLNGKVPAAKRKLLIQAFEENEECQVFLSTEAGGSGLNLQIADTVINFEIPWNPSKKNQRIGRIDRIGQKNQHLSVINFICQDSIEMQIAGGLILKQNLFDGVLNKGSDLDKVDFSQKGRAQFIQQLEEFVKNAELEDIRSKKEEDIVEEIIESPEIESVNIEEGDSEDKVNDIYKPTQDFEKMEEVLNKGMQFLSGIYEMTTGKPLGGKEGAKIEVDKESGEVVMRFKF